MKNVALTNCWCGFADGWDEVLKRKDGLTLLKAVRNGGYKSKLANSGYKWKYGLYEQNKSDRSRFVYWRE